MLSKPEFRLLAILANVVLAVLSFLFCSLWIGQIRDFKALNNAKFEVLNAMAPHVKFSPSNDTRVSAVPFAKEWEILKKKDATEEIYSSHIIALKSSNIEFLVPRAFRWIFISIAILTLWSAILNWQLFWNDFLMVAPQSASPLMAPSASPSSGKL